ncbi:MAG: transposase [Armatimonadota bacterium]
MPNKTSNEGSKGEARTRRFFTPSDKAKIVMESMAAGGSPTDTIKARGIHPNVFYRWRTAFIDGGTKALAGEAPVGADASEMITLREQNRKLKQALGEMYLKLLDYEQAGVGVMSDESDYEDEMPDES